MTKEYESEVWSMLDRDYLHSVASRGPRPIFATISGAHLYGFASPDSDVDLRGAFLHPARALLGLHPPDETITIEDKTRLDLDWVAHDLRKFADDGESQWLRDGTALFTTRGAQYADVRSAEAPWKGLHHATHRASLPRVRAWSPQAAS